ncbi:hypothetical protein QAD02_021895 [Eretmocerus hayati]|uniref:Uncharacterized protein n=1 Tax=Eretmocerus hayati TaxID=131215 RepID=A0ACC2PT28_9HYME|nr:hypothetical protein QAD02_021895 [Eretmocerus hayati]
MLPPPEGALEQHSYRVYHQLQAWRGGINKALDWGWSESHYGLKPIMLTNKKYSIPEDILRDFFCSCKSGCESYSCGCSKRGLKCPDLCKVCVGKDCSNFGVIDNDGTESDGEVVEWVDDQEIGNDYDEIIDSVVKDFQPEGDQDDVDISITVNDRRYGSMDGVESNRNSLEESENMACSIESDVTVYEQMNSKTAMPEKRSKNSHCTYHTGYKSDSCGCVERGHECSSLYPNDCIDEYDFTNGVTCDITDEMLQSSVLDNDHDSACHEKVNTVANKDSTCNDDWNNIDANDTGMYSNDLVFKSYVQESSPIHEGEFRSKELKKFLEVRNLTRTVFISEDETVLVPKVMYDSRINELVGYVLPTDENSMPIPHQFKATSMRKMQDIFRDNKRSTHLHVYMAQPIQEDTPSFWLLIFGTDGYSADGDTKCLKAVWYRSGLGDQTDEPVPGPVDEDYKIEGFNAKYFPKEVYIEDTVHVLVRLKTRLLKVSIL